jgi:zinc transport system permease protein
MEYLDFLQYEFIRRALLGGVLLGVTCAVLGVFLVLRNMALIGEGLAHITFGGLALGLLLNLSPFWVALPLGVVGSVGILILTKQPSTDADSAIGILSSMGIAGGVMIASLAGGFNVDLFSFLFGNILSISNSELLLSIIASLFTLIIIIINYYDILYITFDPQNAHVSGVNVNVIEYLLATLTGIIVVLSVSSLVILPASTALLVSKSFSSTIYISALVASTSIISGIILSYFLNAPTGALIVLQNGSLYLLIAGYKYLSK